jgi:hypothetical protein
MTKKPFYRFIVHVERNFSEFQEGKDARYIAIYNDRRKPGNRKRKYKYTKKRYEYYLLAIGWLWQTGRAEPDFTRAHMWGIDRYPEDPSLTQEKEWPFK